MNTQLARLQIVPIRSTPCSMFWFHFDLYWCLCRCNISIRQKHRADIARKKSRMREVDITYSEKDVAYKFIPPL